MSLVASSFDSSHLSCVCLQCDILNVLDICRYLIPISLPPEALASDTIATLREDYQLVMDEFKETHKLYQKSKKENSQFRELRGDIEIIEMEKENGNDKRNMKIEILYAANDQKREARKDAIQHEGKLCVNKFPFRLLLFISIFCILVKKRIDRTQSRLDRLSNQELLLDAAHALRIERERQKELQTQLEQQMQDIQRANTVHTFF